MIFPSGTNKIGCFPSRDYTFVYLPNNELVSVGLGCRPGSLTGPLKLSAECTKCSDRNTPLCRCDAMSAMHALTCLQRVPGAPTGPVVFLEDEFNRFPSELAYAASSTVVIALCPSVGDRSLRIERMIPFDQPVTHITWCPCNSRLAVGAGNSVHILQRRCVQDGESGTAENVWLPVSEVALSSQASGAIIIRLCALSKNQILESTFR